MWCVPREDGTRSSWTAPLVLIAAIVAVAGLGALVLWVLPSALTRHPSWGMSSADRLKATNDARGPLVAFVVFVGAVGTLLFTGLTYRLGREGQVTERYSRAVSQVGDPSMSVRVGAMYSLERIGRSSKVDRTSIIFLLGAFIREHSLRHRDPGKGPDEDVLAAIRVASRLLPATNVRLNLTGADLRHVDLSRFDAGKLILTDARLDHSTPPRHEASAGSAPPLPESEDPPS
jgi:hypothetical protein